MKEKSFRNFIDNLVNSKKIIVIIIIFFALFIVLIALFIQANFFSFNDIKGIENYNKYYYMNEYNSDINSNLSIFPDNNLEFINPKFSSSFRTKLFDISGYIILKTNYSKENFDLEIERLKSLNMTIFESCYEKSNRYNNEVLYDEDSYTYPAYITIDGFDSKFEYALINEEDLEIIYIYLSYPDINDNNSVYKKYLKGDKSKYSKYNILNRYSMYNHSFDNGKSFMDFNEC